MFHLSRQAITRLIGELEAFHRDNPLSTAMETLYHKAPVELMVRTFLATVFDEVAEEDAATHLAQSALEAGLPYTLLMGDINFLQQAVVRYSDRYSDDPVQAFMEISNAFSRTRNEVARVFLMDAASQNGLLAYAGKLRGQVLLRIYDAWFSRLREAVVSGDLAQLDQLSHGLQEFTRALAYPESQMVCMDAHSCEQLALYHRAILNQSVMLHFKLLESAFEEALLIYNELVAQVKRVAALLTTLYFNYQTNRLGVFFRYVQEQARMQKSQFLGLVNLRGLNRINQLQGEAVGDQHLEAVEDILQQRVDGERDWLNMVRGLAGDYYLVMDTDDPKRVRDFLDRFRAAVQAEIELPEVHCSAVYMPYIDLVDGDSLRRIVHFLHQHMAKGQSLEIYDSRASVADVNRWVRERLEQALDIRKLLDERQVEAWLQPIVAPDGTILAFEALGRLVSGERTVSAGLFIDRLLELGLMEAFDRLMLDTLAKEVESLEHVSDCLFINVSSQSLLSESYRVALDDFLRGPARGMDVVMEITEQALLENNALIVRLHQEHGMRFAIDDFGAGYSSLSTVIELAEAGAIGWLKFDGSLTRRLEQGTGGERIFQVVQQMAGALGLSTVAEHVESEATCKRLRMLGVDAVQGFHTGEPDSIRKWRVRQQMAAAER